MGASVQFEAGGHVRGADPDCKEPVCLEGGVRNGHKQEGNLEMYRSSPSVVLGPAASASPEM